MQSSLIKDRLKKIKLWQDFGQSGYATKFKRSHTSGEAKEFIFGNKNNLRNTEDIMEKPKRSVLVCGRIMQKREMGALTFLQMQDADGRLQICLTKKVLKDYKFFAKNIDLGDFIGFSGEGFTTKHGEPTILAAKVQMLSKALRPLPEKFHGLQDKEVKYRQRYLDLISNRDTFERFVLRSKIIREIREFFYNKNFIEIETRTLQTKAGGAMARVFETRSEALGHTFPLRISLELEHKMAVAGGMERVFEIGKCFRNEGQDPSHLPEFTLLEWYCAYQGLEMNKKWTEEMIRQILKKVIGSEQIEMISTEGRKVKIDFSKKWKTVSFSQLLKKYAGIDVHKISRTEAQKIAISKYQMPRTEAEKLGKGNLLDFIYKKTARPQIIGPIFVTNYPSDLKPLARPLKDGTADCFQLLIAGWEIVNSYGELIDPLLQRKLLEDQARAKKAGDAEAMEVDLEFLTAMEHGFPPMTGFGMGIDRFISLLTGQSNLRDTILFPLMLPTAAAVQIRNKNS